MAALLWPAITPTAAGTPPSEPQARFSPTLARASPQFAVATAIAVQSDGKIVATGFSNGEGCCKVTLARYKTDGSLDSSFGAAGKVLTDAGSCVPLTGRLGV